MFFHSKGSDGINFGKIPIATHNGEESEMAVKHACIGQKRGFHLLPVQELGYTLGDPEQIIWQSIRQLCALEFAKDVLKNSHGIESARDRNVIANNIKVYIRQACDFYEAARTARLTTAPLFYYYCFLNLAKALCEIKNPDFWQLKENFHHGLAGTRKRETVKTDFFSESVTIYKKPGVWHKLWSILHNEPCKINKNTEINIKDLFSLCPGIKTEYENIFREKNNIIGIKEINIFSSFLKDRVWIRFAVKLEQLKRLNFSIEELLDCINQGKDDFCLVESDSNDIFNIELKKPIKIDKDFEAEFYKKLHPYIMKLNLFVIPGHDKMFYLLPKQVDFPMPLSQIMVSYTLLFWLGTLVRYSPHNVLNLQDRRYWVLIDAFLTQSVIWLLELFEWQFYQREALLKSGR